MGASEYGRYTSLSRFTNPGGMSALLEGLPDDLDGICTIAREQTIHHNLLGYYQTDETKRKRMVRIWPPKMSDLLKALKEIEPHNLKSKRSPDHRIIGACILESHLLAGILRHKRIPVRIRAGYFRNIMSHPKTTLRFWEVALRARSLNQALFEKDPTAWRREIDEFSRKQIACDHRIEHWICEYWEVSQRKWRLLDANNTFLKAHSKIDVPFRLPREYFECSFETWKGMRRDPGFNGDQYAEEPQDGSSHIRSQMLLDFFSLLNHDVAGLVETSPEMLEFVKERKYAELSHVELSELDGLASLLSRNPRIEELAEFYRKSRTLKSKATEEDPYSFLIVDCQSS